MIAFLRKYQRWFFVLTTIMVVASFCFFGTYSTLQQKSERRDKKVGVALDQSALYSSTIDRMSFFLSHDALFSSGKTVNILNDGVFYKDFVQTGLLDILLAEYFPLVQKEFTSSWEKAKNAHFYTHPYAPNLSQKAIFSHFVPEMNTYLDTLQQSKKPDLKAFFLMKDIFQVGLKMPSELMKRILLYQQNQYRLPQDQKLYYEEFALFGFQSLQDWFGQTCIDLMSETILNVAALARKSGVEVSYEEALRDLVKNVHIANQKEEKKEKISDRDYFTYQLHVLGLDEKMAVSLWQNVLLFRKFFQERTSSLFLDNFSYKDFSTYSMEKKEMFHYQLPESLRFNSFDDLLAFEIYRKNIFPKYEMTSLDLPGTMVALEDLEAKEPGCIQKWFELEVKETSLEATGVSKIRERDLWKWQLEDANWDHLRSQFAEIGRSTTQDRFHVLESIDKDLRRKVD
ncbi:MAG: hypothetical protein WCP39_08220, partial [Chlamydiota bacterium]